MHQKDMISNYFCFFHLNFKKTTVPFKTTSSKSLLTEDQYVNVYFAQSTRTVFRFLYSNGLFKTDFVKYVLFVSKSNAFTVVVHSV